MNYEEAKSVVEAMFPDLIIMPTASTGHIALQKKDTDVPFCISVPSAAHLMKDADPADILEAEKASLIRDVQAYRSR